jgi:hypothetical protein
MLMEDIYLIAVGFIAAASLVVSMHSRRGLKRMLTELRLEFQQQIDSLSAKVAALNRTADVQHAAASAPAPSEKLIPGAAGVQATAQVCEEITAEIFGKIAETITALIGRKIHIRSVKILEQQAEICSAWAQQGRVVIQASHNLPQRGHE